MQADPTPCACGCGRPTNNSRGRQARYIRGHQMRTGGPDYEVLENGCWEWRQSTRKGYGRAHVDGKSVPAHRVYFERFKGPIPEGLQLDHLCRNRLCVNPEHLEAVTQHENLLRGAGTKLSAEDVALIRSRKISAPEAVARFGLHRQYVYAIRNNRRRTNA